MDKQGRLTRWDEWRVGETYRWLKGGRQGQPLLCAEVNIEEGFVRFLGGADAAGDRCFNWRGRFVHVAGERPERGRSEVAHA